MKSDGPNVDSKQFVGTASKLLSNPADDSEVTATLASLLPQALCAAISSARTGLNSELVSWTLAHLTGQLGGFTQVCEVNVAITAKAGST